MTDLKKAIIDNKEVTFLELLRDHNKELMLLADEHKRDAIYWALKNSIRKIEKKLIIEYAKEGNDKFFDLADKYCTHNCCIPALRNENYKIAIHSMLHDDYDLELEDMTKLLPHCDDEDMRDIVRIILENYDDEDMDEIIANSDEELAERLRKRVECYNTIKGPQNSV